MNVSQIANSQTFFDSKFEISALAQAAEEFRATLATVKAEAAPSDFPWYPYDSLSNFHTLNRLLIGDQRNIAELAEGLPILDLGCADGDTSFFLEHAGFEVDAIDRSTLTNYNSMQGVRTLKNALKSNVEIYEADLDAKFELPRPRYGLVLFLGLLYHLKNPFFVLETLSRHASYCLLSTRIARFAPGKSRLLEDLPVAYLLSPREANDDPTNFWIFSRAGLERLLSRTGWQLRDHLYVGNTDNSDPATNEGDERAFCLLKSRAAEGAIF